LKLSDPGHRQTLALHPHRTDTVRISLLDWKDVIDRTALGFDQLKPPGLAEVTVLGPDGKPVAPADAPTNRNRIVEIPCGKGPIVAMSGRFVQTHISTTVDALRKGEPIAARACDPSPIMVPAGAQELLISPGPEFVVDGAQLDGPYANNVPTAPMSSANVASWSPDRREINLDREPITRVLVVPESINPGWVAHNANGAALTPVIVNGWQQGWVIPAGQDGTITLDFPSNKKYRAGLVVGLALLPFLFALALTPGRRRRPDMQAATPYLSRIAGVTATVLAGAIIAGTVGVIVFGTAIAVHYLLRNRQELRERVTLWVAPVGLILAGATLSRYPWRSVDGYIGHSPWVQLLAVLSLGWLAASALPTVRRHRRSPTSEQQPAQDRP
jgi:arabinofuranan 3-O-arabinosyltransferase